ncbi:adenylate/guanylate cyclase domain-containing protein [Ruegeria sp. HKCCA5763]|uniref:adenylate/guanylate cyclase domain-containing protein n=1 Tax=Ruegeria sp. HKCCA5763 TaxID=2682987 RepID=UPI0014882F8D|nr:adenylate/guanylate cyclase domain-containing protein [Ruegeria sp. HKCCA5763]
MNEEPVERRLTAILAADVVGFGRLMEANEERTLASLRHHRREFFDPTLAKHGGRLFKVMGDGFLVEFSSVTSAVRCAVEIQRGMPGRNTGVPEDRQIKFRIGVNVGDLIVDGDDFHGDGVILATRLEGLAKPGGIACSATARSQIGSNLDVKFADQGEIAVKNASQLLRVYFVELFDGASASTSQRQSDAKVTRVSDIPSVAVLPFANVSNEPEQEYFSDGITEDIITDLSKVSGLSVISRNTVFTLKGKALNLEETARNLGVAYLVEGSVRKAGNRVRITVQLVVGATDQPIWAERYDRELTDIFAVQDEITQAVVDQLKVTLLPEEKEAIEREQTDSTDAYNAYLRGAEFLRNRTKSSLLSARQLFAQAVEFDPGYARAYAGMANCATWLKTHHGADITVAEILSITDQALAIDPDLADAYAARGAAMWIDDRREEAISAFEQALSIDPDSYEALFYSARFFETIGNFESAVVHYTRATEVRPDDYQAPLRLSEALFSLRQLETATRYAQIGIKRAEEALRQHPENSRPAQLGAAALARIGEPDRAKSWLTRAMEIDPDDNHMRYNAACTYAQLGEIDLAFEMLDLWIDKAATNLLLWFQSDPDLEPIRGDLRYQGLLARAVQ